MTEPELRRALQNIRVAAPTRDLGGVAWRRAARARRRRRGFAVAGVMAVVGSVGLLAGVRVENRDAAPPAPAGSPRPTVSPAPSGVGSALVWLMPPVADETALPRRPSRLPAAVGAPAADAPQLSEAGITRFVAAGVRKVGASSVVAVLGEDGQWRLAASGLEEVADRDGNRGSIIGPNAISPDGLTLAVTQPDAVLVIDRTGLTRRVAVGGPYNQQSSWLRNGSLRVVSDAASYDLDPRRGSTSLVRADSAFDAADLILTTNRRPVLRQATASGRSVDTGVLLPAYEFLGPAASNSRSVARAMATTELLVPGGHTANPEALAVVDRETGSTRAVLVAADTDGRSKVCCRAVAWLDDITLAYQAGTRLLAWDTSTGVVTLVAELPAWVTAVAP